MAIDLRDWAAAAVWNKIGAAGWNRRLAFQVEELVADALEERVAAEVGQVGIAQEHVVIVEPDVDGFVQGGSRLLDFAG